MARAMHYEPRRRVARGLSDPLQGSAPRRQSRRALPCPEQLRAKPFGNTGSLSACAPTLVCLDNCRQWDYLGRNVPKQGNAVKTLLRFSRAVDWFNTRLGQIVAWAVLLTSIACQ